MSVQRFYLRADGSRANIEQNLVAFIQRLPETKDWRVSIEPDAKTVSSKQYGALFGVAYKAIMEYMGLRGDKDKQELHEFWCGEYFGWRPANEFMRARPMRTTTTDENGKRDRISAATAVDFYDFIQQHAAEHGVYVPDPDPYWREAARKEQEAT